MGAVKALNFMYNLDVFYLYIIFQVCEKPFRSLGNLKRHLLVHSEEKQFSCDRCGKLFRTSDEVKKHMLVHTQETPYTCSVCQKKFRQSCHLGRHMLIHSGVKQHVCVICEKKFTQAEALRSHMQLHTGVRPFPCNYCEDSFKRRWQLRVHLAAKHGEEEPNNGRISCDRGETCDSIDSCDNMEACDIEASFKFQVCDNIGSSDMTDSQHSDYEQHQDKEIIIKTEPQTDEGRELKIKTEPCDSMETCDRLEPNFNFQVCDSVRSNDSESHHEDTEQHESKAIVIKAEPQTEGDEGRELKIKTEPKAEDGSSIQCDRMESRNSIQSCDMIEAYGRLESSLEETGLHKDKEMIIKTEPNTEDEASIWASSNTNNNKDNFKGGLQHESKENSQLMIGKRELHTKLRSKTIDRLHKAESKADKVHICEVCLRQFTEASSLKSHMLSHTSEEITDSKVFQKHFEYCL